MATPDVHQPKVSSSIHFVSKCQPITTTQVASRSALAVPKRESSDSTVNRRQDINLTKDRPVSMKQTMPTPIQPNLQFRGQDIIGHPLSTHQISAPSPVKSESREFVPKTNPTFAFNFKMSEIRNKEASRGPNAKFDNRSRPGSSGNSSNSSRSLPQSTPRSQGSQNSGSNSSRGNLPQSTKPNKDAAPKQHFNEGRWTKDEHEKFVKGLEMYGKEWKKIAEIIPSRSIVQIRTHAQKFFQKVARVSFEKRGMQVPDALKSTAIKTSYNFQDLQQALSVHTPVMRQKVKDGSSSLKSKKSSSGSLVASGSLGTSGMILRGSAKNMKKDRKPRTKAKVKSKKSQVLQTNAANTAETMRRTKIKKQAPKPRRTSRKSSKYAPDLRNLTLNCSDDEDFDRLADFNADADLFGFDYNDAAPSLSNFSFSCNNFSKIDSIGLATFDNLSSRRSLKKAKSCDFNTFQASFNALDVATKIEQEQDTKSLVNGVDAINDLFDIEFGDLNGINSSCSFDSSLSSNIFDDFDKKPTICEGDSSDSTSTNTTSNLSTSDPLLELMDNFGDLGDLSGETPSTRINTQMAF